MFSDDKPDINYSANPSLLINKMEKNPKNVSLTITHLFVTWYIAVIFVPQQEPEQGGVGREPPCRPRVGPAAVFVLTGFRHILL